MSEATLAAILLTLKVASVSTLCVFVPATLLGYWFARSHSRLSLFTSAIVSLPLVLPPTAVGYLLLRLFAHDGPFGPEVLGFQINFLLTWKAAIVAAGVMALPLVVRTTKVAFEGVDARMVEVGMFQSHRRIAGRYNYPNARMYQQDEKLQQNRFLADWLEHCLANGRLGVDVTAPLTDA